MTPNNSDRRGEGRGQRQDRSERWGRADQGGASRPDSRGRGERQDRRGYGGAGRRDERSDRRFGDRREFEGGGERPRYRDSESRRDDRGYSGGFDRGYGRDSDRRGDDNFGRRNDRSSRGGYGRSGGSFEREDRRGFDGSDRRDDRRSYGDRRFERDDRRPPESRRFERDDRRSYSGRGDDRRRPFGERDERSADRGGRDAAGVTRGPRSWDRRPDDSGRRVPKAPEPELPDEITGRELDRSVWAQLRTLTKDNADGVAKHLVSAAELLDLDPEKALAHAQHAVTRAGRVPAAREALGLVLYRTGEYAEALREFRTARRLSGSDHLLPYMVDCERGLGRYERALELANSPEAQRLSEADNIELAIVVSGVRRDMGQARAAVVGLRIPALKKATTQPWAARLFYAYADALLDIDEVEEAREWFVKAAAADAEGETDADERIAELDGVVLEDLTPGEEDILDPRLADIDLSKPFGSAAAGDSSTAKE